MNNVVSNRLNLTEHSVFPVIANTSVTTNTSGPINDRALLLPFRFRYYK